MAVATDKILAQVTTGTLTARLGPNVFRPTAALAGAGTLTADLTVPFANYRRAILDGFVSAQSEAAGWNAQKANLPLTAVVRTSDTVVTITLTALAAYDITAQETITVTVPAGALAGGIDIVATPTFTIDATAAAANIVAVLAGSGSVVVGLLARNPILAALIGIGTLTAQASARFQASGTLSGTGSVAANTSEPREWLNEILAGGGTVSVALKQTWATNSAVLSAIGTVKADVTGGGAIPQILATIAGVGTVAAALSERAVVAAQLAGLGAISANPLPAFGVFATLSGTGAVSAVTRKVAADNPTLSGIGALVAGLTPPRDLNALLAGGGTVSAFAWQVWKSNPAVLSGLGTLVADPRVAGQGIGIAGTLPGFGAIFSDVMARLNVRAALAGVGTLMSSEGSLLQVRAALAGVGSLAAAFAAAQAAGSMAGAGTLSARLALRAASLAILAGDGNLVGWVLERGPVSATLAGSGAIWADGKTGADFCNAQLIAGGAIYADLSQRYFVLASQRGHPSSGGGRRRGAKGGGRPSQTSTGHR